MAINMAKIDEMLKLATPEQKAAFNQSSVGQQYTSQQPQTAAPTTVGKTAEQLQGELIAAQKASQLGSLEAAYKNSMGAFNQQMKLLPQEYRNQRIGVDTNMQKQNRSFGEFMASRGLKSSGAAAQGTIANSVAAQGASSQLRSEEMNAMNALRNQMLAAQTNYNADVAGVESGAAADLAKYQIEDLKAKESENKQMALDTLGRYSQDYTQGIIDIKGDGDASNDWMIPYLEAARSEKVAGIESSKAQAEAAQYEAAMDRWKLTGVADATVAALIGVPVGTPTSDYKFKAANLELDRYKASKSGSSGGGGYTYTQAMDDARMMLPGASPAKIAELANQLLSKNVTMSGTTQKEEGTLGDYINSVYSLAQTNPQAAIAMLEKQRGKITDEKDRDFYNSIYDDIYSRIPTSTKLLDNNTGLSGLIKNLW